VGPGEDALPEAFQLRRLVAQRPHEDPPGARGQQLPQPRRAHLGGADQQRAGAQRLDRAAQHRPEDAGEHALGAAPVLGDVQPGGGDRAREGIRWLAGQPELPGEAVQALEPRVACGSDDYNAVPAFVAVGLGVAMLPRLALAYPHPGLDRVALADPPVRRIVAARLAASHRSPATASMLGVLQTTAPAFRDEEPGRRQQS
jgi:DNA-binding transcriptional LysR family regulator